MVDKAISFIEQLSPKLPVDLEPFIEHCTELVDAFVTQQKVVVRSTFFDTKPLVPPNNNEFVEQFNKLIIELKIRASICSLFVPLSPVSFQLDKTCSNCMAIDWLSYDGIQQCNSCGLTIKNFTAAIWSDATRIHTTPDYFYDRKLLFQRFILQYQGKCIVDETILDHVPAIQGRLSKIEFLQMLKRVSKRSGILIYRDQVHYLYYKYYAIPGPDLTIYETQLLNDYDLLSAMSFKYKNVAPVCNQFLIWQFLNRYKVKTSRCDVLLNENYEMTNNVYKNMFKELGWHLFN